MSGAITVLVGTRIHPVSQRPCRCPADSAAVALALGLGLPVRMLSAGHIPDSVARDYLATGAGLIEIVSIGNEHDHDAQPPAAQLSALLSTLLPHLQSSDWVLTGARAQPGQGTGLLPYALAAALNRPMLSDVLAIEPDAAGWTITQSLPRGARRRLRVQAPAVLAMAAATAAQPRHSFAAALAGRMVRIPAANMATAATTATVPATPSGTAAAVTTAQPCQRVPAKKLRPPLAAGAAHGGAQRMLAAIDSKASGGAVIDGADARANAQALLDYLLRHALLAPADSRDSKQHSNQHIREARP